MCPELRASRDGTVPTVWIPSLMRSLTDGQAQVQATGRTVRDVLEDLEATFPGFRSRLCEGDRLRPDMAVAVDGQICSEGLRTAVERGSEVHFLPAVTGG